MAWNKYVLYLAQEHIDFRIPVTDAMLSQQPSPSIYLVFDCLQEIRSLLQLLQIPYRLPTIDQEQLTPFIHIELPNDECARRLASRSVAIRYVLEQWASAPGLTAFHHQFKQYLADNATNPGVADNFHVNKSFRITVETFNNTIQHKEKIEKIESLSYMPVAGDVSLSDPDVHWYYIEYYGLDTVNVPVQPLHVLFGKWVSLNGLVADMFETLRLCVLAAHDGDHCDFQFAS